MVNFYSAPTVCDELTFVCNKKQERNGRILCVIIDGKTAPIDFCPQQRKIEPWGTTVFSMWQRRVCVLFELSNSTTTTGWLVFLSRSTRLTFGKYLRPDNSEVQNDNGDNKQRQQYSCWSSDVMRQSRSHVTATQGRAQGGKNRCAPRRCRNREGGISA